MAQYRFWSCLFLFLTFLNPSHPVVDVSDRYTAQPPRSRRQGLEPALQFVDVSLEKFL